MTFESYSMQNMPHWRRLAALAPGTSKFADVLWVFRFAKLIGGWMGPDPRVVGPGMRWIFRAMRFEVSFQSLDEIAVRTLRNRGFTEYIILD